jgi:hypothetical protein
MPSTPKVLRDKERTPTLYPSIVFTFGLVVESIKEFWGVSLYIFITFAVTSSIDFGVLVYAIGFLDCFVDVPNSCTIILPNSNLNGNPSTNYSLLGGTYSSASLNFLKAGYVTTLFVKIQ